MSKTKSATAPSFDHIQDEELRKKLQEVAQEHIENAKLPLPLKSNARFAFSRATPEREIGAPVRVRNPFDEDSRGGTIIERLAPNAYQVDVGGNLLVVFEPDSTWE